MPAQYLLPFVKGLNTDQGIISGDSSYTRDELNVPLEKDGSRKVRLGMDYDTTSRFTLSGTTLVDTAFSSFTWENAGNKDKSFVVCQQGLNLHFFDASVSDLISGFVTTINITKASYHSASEASKSFAQYAVGNGHLFVVSRSFEPCLIKWDGTSLTKSNVTIRIRDIYSLPDDVDIEALPTTMTNNLKYNLFNMGWYLKVNNRTGAVVHVLDEFYTKETNFPAKTYQWWRGKRESSNGQFYSEDLKNIFKGRTEAPKGHYIINAFARNNSRASVTTVGPAPDYSGGQDVFLNSVNGPISYTYTQFDEERNRPSAVAWYAGRVFWSGVQSDVDGAYPTSPDFTGYVFYSQTVRNDNDYGKCYQEADPTSEEDSGIVATDGGFLVIPGAGKVHKMIVLRDSLIILADRQILAIRGGDIGFTAEEHQTYQILDVGIAGPGCAVVAEGSLFVWAKDGIYNIGYNPQTGGISAQNISSASVQNYVIQVNPVQQAYMQSVYDSLNKKVSWWYNTNNTFTGSTEFSRVLEEFTYDALLQAFSRNAIANSSTYLLTAPFYTTSPRVTSSVNNVVVGSDTVVVGSDSVTIAGTGYTYSSNKVYAFIVNLTNSNLGVGYYKNTEYKDFNTNTYTAYLQGNNDILGSATSKKYPLYVRCQFRRTETMFVDNGSGQPILNNQSACKLQAKWDFSDSSNSGKWSDEQDVYRFTRPYMPDAIGASFTYGQEVITTKTKILGTGRALSFKFNAVAGKGFHFLGYSFDGVVNDTL